MLYEALSDRNGLKDVTAGGGLVGSLHDGGKRGWG